MLQQLRLFLNNTIQELKYHEPKFTQTQDLINYFFLFISGSILALQFLTYSAVMFNTAESRPVVATIDDDTQEAIRLTQNTFLINDNGARAYGPIYYRIASAFQHFSVNTYSNFEMSKKEQSERSTHFSLMIVNLASIFLYCFLIARLIHSNTAVCLTLTYGLVQAIMNNEIRSSLSFMGKPDHALVFFVSLAFLYTWRWLSDFENKQLIIKSAATWALAASTKLSVLFFVPGLISLWFGRKITSTKWTLPYFIKWIVIFYFVVGIPQNFDVVGYVSYLLHQGSYTSFVSWDFFTRNWLRLFSADLKLPIIYLTVVVPFFYSQKSDQAQNHKQQMPSAYFRILLFCLITFLFITHKQTRSPYEWYTFPVTNIILITYTLVYQKLLSIIFSNQVAQKLVAFFQNHFLNRLNLGIKTLILSEKSRLTLTLLIFGMNNNYSDSFYQQHKIFNNCRQESHQFMKEINTRAARGDRFLVDPAAPYDHQYHDKNIFMQYEMKTKDLIEVKPKFLALKKIYYQMYLPRSEGGTEIPTTHITDIEDTRNFYRTYFNKDSGSDIHGQIWKKIYSDQCSFELWERQ